VRRSVRGVPSARRRGERRNVGQPTGSPVGVSLPGTRARTRRQRRQSSPWHRRQGRQMAAARARRDLLRTRRHSWRSCRPPPRRPPRWVGLPLEFGSRVWAPHARGPTLGLRCRGRVPHRAADESPSAVASRPRGKRPPSRRTPA
jgi:hypothetical protein